MLLDDLLELGVILLLMHEALELLNQIPSRRFWVRKLYQDRDYTGLFASSFEEMHERDPEQFQKSVRMTPAVFDMLLELLKTRLTKMSHRPSISASCRLFLTLTYLAHGDSKQTLATAFKMGRSTVTTIITEVCEAVWEELEKMHLSPPQKCEWKRIAEDFNTMWKFPNCVGAVDGKHITISCPANSGSLYYNYKRNYPLILLATCDANYTFTNVDTGTYGSQSDGGILWNSGFGQRLLNGDLDLPEDAYLPETSTTFPYFMVGDAAFPLKNCIMRPYPGNCLSLDKEIFNKRLSRVRRVIENAFGILCARWRVLLSPLFMHPKNAEKLIKATIVLHNFVKFHDSSYCPPEYVDRFQGDEIINGLWRSEVSAPLRNHGRMTCNNASRNAFALRDQLKDYIMSHPINK